MNLDWTDREVGSKTIRTSLTQAEADELRTLATNRAVLEIGSAFGFSTVHMARWARSIVSVDPHAWLESGEKFLDNIDGMIVLPVFTTSDIALKALVGIGAKFDLAFIDGDHSASWVRHDIQGALDLLVDDGLLAIHDYDEAHCPDVKTVVDALRLTPEYVVDTLFVTRKGQHG